MARTARAAQAAAASRGTSGLALAVPGLGRRLDPRAWLLRCLEQEVEQRRLFPWIAVAFGTGIGLFFAAEGRQSLAAPLTGLAAFTALAVWWRARPVALAVAIALAAVMAGFAAGVLRLSVVEAPVLSRLTIGKLGGFVESIEERQTGARLVIRLHDLAGVAAQARPRRVRVTTRDIQALAPGVYIVATARLLPLPEAARPGGYDFARDAYFRGIGAVGSILGRADVLAPPVPPDISLRIASGIDRARNGLTRRIADAIGGPAGAVAAALITGKRGLIDERTNDILRAAGIYHIVSISGLHMVLAAGAFFAITRALLALAPGIALLWPVKKMAALVGMAGANAYCIFSGADVATERSLCMILVMMGAILFDRPALSIRNLAISALIVLAREPETLLGPSLQMSYAAVAGLIAMAEWLRARREPRAEGGWLDRLTRWALAAALGILATTLVASFATAPFGSFHFQTLNPYGLIGNALTLPLVSLVVMPAAVLGVLALPFGLDRPIWWLMGGAVAQVLRVSQWVSDIAGSTVVVPAFGPGALVLFVAGLLLFTLLVSPLRWLAAAPVAFGLWHATTPARVDLFVGRDGSGAALRGTDGRLVLLGRVPAFVAEQWLEADGDARKASDEGLRAGSRCDRLGCVAEMQGGGMAAVVLDKRAFAEDCRRASIVISRLDAPAGCQARLVIDRRRLAEGGAIAVRLKDGVFEVATSRRPGETRPWLARANPPRAPPSTAGGGSPPPSAPAAPEDADERPDQ